jgi:hypothetical protein
VKGRRCNDHGRQTRLGQDAGDNLRCRHSGWQFPVDPFTLIGRQYEVPVCFVYHLNAKGKIYLLHEYLDLASLMKQLE